MTKNEILKKIKENQKILRQYGVTHLALFGSYAREENDQTSDIDFIVEFKKKTFDDYIGLKQSLEDLFELKVDLVLKNTIKPRILAHIQQDLIDAA